MAEGLDVADGPNVADGLFDGTIALPRAVVLRDALEHNIATMAAYCHAHGVRLAPHAKTTMCPAIVARQLQAGAWAVTVANPRQALVLDAPRILIANQVVDPGSLRQLHVLRDREVYCYADSTAALEALESVAFPGLRVLVEIGVPAGRTGLRDDPAALELARRVEAGPLTLGGIAAFEGILDPGPRLDALLERLAGLAQRIDGIVTLGGSVHFDRAVQALPNLAPRLVLRSGCYVTHDGGYYDRLSPFGNHATGPYRLREALEVWGTVLSRPEPESAVLGIGRRDVSHDAGLPSVRHIRRHGNATATLDPADLEVTALNDQHLILRLPADHPLAVGDAVGLSVSHPCTTFDKWRSVLIVDEGYSVVEDAPTLF